jgi:hypothetical protein
MEKIDLAALVQMFVMVDQFDGHALRIGLTPGTEQLFGAQLGRIEFLVLNEAFQHLALWCIGIWLGLIPSEIIATAYTSRSTNCQFFRLKQGVDVKYRQKSHFLIFRGAC